MIKITSLDNHEFNIDCIGCAIAKKEVIPYGGIISESKHFIVSPDFEVPIPGFIIIASKRHISSILDFTPEELKDFNLLLIKTRKALKQVKPNLSITLIQKEKRPHFHLWLFPQYDWMEPFGDKVSSISGILNHARQNLKSKDNLSKIKKLNQQLQNLMKNKS